MVGYGGIPSSVLSKFFRMGKGQCVVNHQVNGKELPTYDWDEVKKHTTANDRWIVVKGCIYDVTSFQKRHPGGARIIGHFAGEDATDAWVAMHEQKDYVAKYMHSLHVGYVKENPTITKTDQINEDFRDLLDSVRKEGLYKVKPIFYILHFLHIVLLDILAYYLLYTYGAGWPMFVVATALLSTAQAQAGWTQHDYGHQSVFNSSKVNHFMHHITIGYMKGASSHWWNFRHHQHHVKPNVFKKDPDITMPHVFMLGKNIPIQYGNQKRGTLPYQHQASYFWFLGPPFLLTVYFLAENLYFVLTRKDWKDLLAISLFFGKHFYLYTPILGSAWSAFGFYLLVRMFESFWFVFVTQMNHIPMNIDKEQSNDWLTSQSIATCNVETSWFNDWFTGHLNFQIEHHLFPTMPRHNYHLVSDRVQALCKKHDLPYVSKPLLTAMTDILSSLKDSGRLWYDAYYHE